MIRKYNAGSTLEGGGQKVTRKVGESLLLTNRTKHHTLPAHNQPIDTYAITCGDTRRNLSGSTPKAIDDHGASKHEAITLELKIVLPTACIAGKFNVADQLTPNA